MKTSRILKRTIDIAVSLTALVLLIPVSACVFLLVLAFHGSPALFRQTRPGLNGQPFSLLKFRSMSTATDADGCLKPDAERTTRFGSFLRSTSLDELPQLWNVLVGDMSLVGPRPLLMEYLPLYSSDERRRHLVRPGITGWAQVNGRNDLSWKEKLMLDVWYVDNWSLRLDVYILLLTMKAVFSRSGVSKEGQVTTVRYNGSN